MSPLRETELAEIDQTLGRSKNFLPVSLPTMEEIWGGRVITQHRHQGKVIKKVVQVGNDYIVKYGTAVRMVEAYTMEKVDRRYEMHAPQVYKAFRKPNEAGEMSVYIIMELIKGRRLDTCWRDLPMASKNAIRKKLRNLLNQMRRGGPSRYGAMVKGMPCYNTIFMKDQRHTRHGIYKGPFRTAVAFQKDLADTYGYSSAGHWEDDPGQLLSRRVLEDEATFTHGDIQPCNIIIADNSHWIKGIVGWSSAGYYPQYWERAMATLAVRKGAINIVKDAKRKSRRGDFFGMLDERDDPRVGRVVGLSLRNEERRSWIGHAVEVERFEPPSPPPPPPTPRAERTPQPILYYSHSEAPGDDELVLQDYLDVDVDLHGYLAHEQLPTHQSHATADADWAPDLDTLAEGVGLAAAVGYDQPTLENVAGLMEAAVAEVQWLQSHDMMDLD